MLQKINNQTKLSNWGENGNKCEILSACHRTPLMYAVWQGNPEIIKFLVEKGAKIESTDTNNHKAINYLDKNQELSQNDKDKIINLFK